MIAPSFCQREFQLRFENLGGSFAYLNFSIMKILKYGILGYSTYVFLYVCKPYKLLSSLEYNSFVIRDCYYDLMIHIILFHVFLVSCKYEILYWPCQTQKYTFFGQFFIWSTNRPHMPLYGSVCITIDTFKNPTSFLTIFFFFLLVFFLFAAFSFFVFWFWVFFFLSKQNYFNSNASFFKWEIFVFFLLWLY